MTPEPRGDEFDGSKEVFRSFVVAGGDTSEVLDPIEEPFHQVPLPIDPEGKGEAALAVGLRWDIGPSLPFGRLGADGVAVVALVGQQDVAFAETVDQRFGLGAVRDLARGQAEGDGPAFSIDERVDLAREPATGTSHAAIISTPFFPVAACWWTRTQVESIMTMSPS